MSASTKDTLSQTLPGKALSWSEFRSQQRLTVEPSDLLAVMTALKEKHGFDMLIDVTAVDYLEYAGAKDRFELVYCLLGTESGERLVVSAFLNEPDLEVASVYGLWKAADWLEREVFDMFGITFAGHPNLRRLLLPEQFASFPLRKDYPVQGRGERHNFPVVTRADS
jgi:NADH-quinone oxidoreductase subunit C